MLITATMREGKSNLASFLMEKGTDLGYNIKTNMLFFSYEEIEEAIAEGILRQSREWYRRVPPEIETVTTASELILGLHRTRRNITLLDEALLFAGSKKGVSKDIRWFEGLVTQIGKFDSSIALLAQTKSKLATLLREDIPSYELKVFKLSFSNRYVQIWYNSPQSVENAEEPYMVDEWKHIPPSRYPYDHKAPAGFEFDIDMEKFIHRISKLNSLKTRKEVPVIIAEMLEENRKKRQPKKTKREIIEEKIKLHPKETSSAIASLCNCSERHVQRIKQQMS